MDVDFDFSDVDSWFDEEKSRVLAKEREIGEEAVQYAKDVKTYKDQTGTLRASNECTVNNEGITLFNGAVSPKGYQYASNVESKGFDVLSGAALHAEERAKEEFE